MNQLQSIEIPLRDTHEVITLNLNELPQNAVADDLMKVLKYENVCLHYWITLAVEYYRRGHPEIFQKFLESSKTDSNTKYKDSNNDKMKSYDLLAHHYVQLTSKEKNENRRLELFSKAEQLLDAASKFEKPDQNHLLARANFWMVKGDKIEHADALFNVVLDQSPNNIPALLGKACILFNGKDYTRALIYFKQAIRKNPRCPAIVRVCLAYCFLKLGNQDKATAAFERALKLDPKCVDALIGLAIPKINKHDKTNVQQGVKMLATAFQVNRENPVVLNHLSCHFFFKKDYQKAKELAFLAVKLSHHKTEQAEGCYHLARILHLKKDYKRAFSFYEKAALFASTDFVLPLYGLGQMYLQQNDLENAVQCFEKILKVQPENFEIMKILGSLYARSSSKSRKLIAEKYLTNVTQQFPDDVEVWVELAQLFEQSHTQACLQAYTNAYEAMKEHNSETISPEIINNIGAIQFNLKNFDASKEKFLEALVHCNRNIEQEKPRDSVWLTVSYNLARTFEALYQFEKAEKLYKDILKEDPKYIDCYLRLGCMARDKNQINEASDWFVEALQINTENPDAWALLGNLHIAEMTTIPKDEKFESVLKNLDHAFDSYPILALGNIWLKALHDPLKDTHTQKELGSRAKALFSKVTVDDSKMYPWAANGIGCVLAKEGSVQEASAIFAQVYDYQPDFCDVWLNIAHNYVEKKEYLSAIRMYENCMKKFYKHHNVEILQYLGRAYFKAEKYEKAKTIFLKARQIAPYDLTIMYNIALVLQKLVQKIFKSHKSNFKTLSQAVRQLELSQRYFQYLAVHGDPFIFDITSADYEAQECHKLLRKIQAKKKMKKLEKNDLKKLGQPDKKVSFCLKKDRKRCQQVPKNKKQSELSKREKRCKKRRVDSHKLDSSETKKKKKRVSWKIPEVEFET